MGGWGAAAALCALSLASPHGRGTAWPLVPRRDCSTDCGDAGGAEGGSRCFGPFGGHRPPAAPSAPLTSTSRAPLQRFGAWQAWNATPGVARLTRRRLGRAGPPCGGRLPGCPFPALAPLWRRRRQAGGPMARCSIAVLCCFTRTDHLQSTMPRGGRHRRGSRTTEPAAAPAAQPTPLGDVSNSRPRAATALLPLKAAAASPAPPAVAPPPPPPLPGLEADSLPAEPCGRLPVTAETFEAFGDALGCLR